MYFLTFLLKNLFRRKVRSGLTVMAVAVAVGTMVSLLSISHNFERANSEAFERRGVDLVVSKAGVANQLDSDLNEKVEIKLLALPGVQLTTPGLVEMISYRRGNSDISVFVQGWRADNPGFRDADLIEGRKIEPRDRRVAMLGENVVGSLKKKVGDNIEISQEDFKVIGTFRSFSAAENGSILVPLADLQELRIRPGRVSGFSVVLDPSHKTTAAVDEICAQINAMTDDRGKSLGLSAKPTSDFVKGSTHIMIANAMAWMTTAIALVIGTIGMLNTMVMSVIERTREIGILRAIGWRKLRVVRMILGEAILVSLAGTVVGTLGAVWVIRWLTQLPTVNGMIGGDIAPAVIGEGVLMALLVGLVGGAYPALRAIRLVPTEAIHHE